MVGKSPNQAPGRGRGHVYSFCRDRQKKKKKRERETIKLRPFNIWSVPVTEVVVTM